MPEEIITRDSAAFKELRRDIVKAIRAVDILIDTHRPTIGNELYLTSEEICSIFSISKLKKPKILIGFSPKGKQSVIPLHSGNTRTEYCRCNRQNLTHL